MSDREHMANQSSRAEQRNLANQRSRGRSLAVQALYQWQISETDSGDLLNQFHADETMDGADREYFDALVRGCLAEAASLRALYDAHLDRPEVQLDPVERAIMLVAVYELRERIDVPWRVVLNEAVSLARRFGAEESHRYINAVLDRVARELRPAEMQSGGNSR